MGISPAANSDSRSDRTTVAELLDIFGFISVLLRGLALSLETLTVGGVLFLLLIAEAEPVYRLLPSFTAALAIVQAAIVLLNSDILMGTTGMSWTDVAGASYFIAGSLVVLGAIGVGFTALASRTAKLGFLFCGCIVAGSVMNSHSVARLDHRWAAIPLTLAHHVAGAIWIGGLLFLLLALREKPYAGGEDRRTILSGRHDFGCRVGRRRRWPGSFVCRFGACPARKHLRHHAAGEDPPDWSAAAFGRPELQNRARVPGRRSGFPATAAQIRGSGVRNRFYDPSGGGVADLDAAGH
jgi:hypothetical protein